MSKQSQRSWITINDYTHQRITPFLIDTNQKNKQIMSRTINIKQSNQQIIGVIPRNSLSPFKWSHRKFLPQLQQKFRYQQTTQVKQQGKKSRMAQRQELDTPISRIKQTQVINQLQPLITIRQLKQGRNFRSRRNNVNLSYREAKDYPPIQFTSRRRNITPIITNVNPERTYIFKSKDQYLKRILDGMGWKQSKNKNGYTYNLKWTNTDTPTDYINIRQGQYFNHIKNSQQMTNKGKLTANLMKQISNIDFYPRTYDLNSQFNQFNSEFHDTGIISLLKKYVQHFKVKCYILFQKPNEIQLGNIIKTKNFINSNHNQNFTLNIALLISLCFYLQDLKRRNKIKSNQTQIPIQTQIILDSRIIETLMAYVKIPIQQKSVLKKSLEDKTLESHIIQSKYETPSDDLISLLIIYYKLFKKNLNGFNVDGINNIWILKPISTSKGQGIQLINRFQANNGRFRNKIAQKYIQNCLIIRGAKKQNYMWKYVQGKKFDIRQWVLVTSQPTKIYRFSSCYLRFCSQAYDAEKIKDQKKHLTNYFVNKGNFQSSDQWSILSIQQLFAYLLAIKQIDIEQYFNQQMNNIILQTLKICMDKLEIKKNCFQLFGFDLLMDQTYKLWLMEVNLSPACQQRTVWLKNMLNQMGCQMLKLVLPAEYVIKMKQTKQKKYQWNLLYQNGVTFIDNELFKKNKLKFKQQFQNDIEQNGLLLINEIKRKVRAKKTLYNISQQYIEKFKLNLIEVCKQLRPYRKVNVFHFNNISLFIKTLELIIRRRKKPIFKQLISQFFNSQFNGLAEQSEDINKNAPKDLNTVDLYDFYERPFLC